MARAVITGATSGIGKVFAYRLGEQGYDLVITGRRKEELTQVAREIAEKYGVEVVEHIIELSSPIEFSALLQEIQPYEDIEVLINNAGFGNYGTFLEVDYFEHENMVSVHIDVALQLIHAIAPAMVKNKRGAIINVSSLLSFYPVPNTAIYSATKAFLTSFSEALASELGPHGIVVQALLPGLTRTDFHRKSGTTETIKKQASLIRWMTSEQVVDASFVALKRGKAICIPGAINRLIVMITNRLLPRSLVYRILRKAVSR